MPEALICRYCKQSIRKTLIPIIVRLAAIGFGMPLMLTVGKNALRHLACTTGGRFTLPLQLVDSVLNLSDDVGSNCAKGIEMDFGARRSSGSPHGVRSCGFRVGLGRRTRRFTMRDCLKLFSRWLTLRDIRWTRLRVLNHPIAVELQFIVSA